MSGDKGFSLYARFNTGRNPKQSPSTGAHFSRIDSIWPYIKLKLRTRQEKENVTKIRNRSTVAFDL